MKIFVKAKARAKEEKVIPPKVKLWKDSTEKEWFTVWVKEPPIQGRANIAIIKTLAKHFKISPSQVILLSGHTSKQKVFDILV